MKKLIRKIIVWAMGWGKPVSHDPSLLDKEASENG